MSFQMLHANFSRHCKLPLLDVTSKSIANQQVISTAANTLSETLTPSTAVSCMCKHMCVPKHPQALINVHLLWAVMTECVPSVP